MSVRRFGGPASLRAASRGLTLIEIMVSLVLGLLVVGGAISIFASNKETYRATDNLARVQESTRIAFELMARDLREAGGNACDSKVAQKSMLNNPAASWWSDFQSGGNGLFAYDGAVEAAGNLFGTTPGSRLAGTDAIEMKGAHRDAFPVVTHSNVATVIRETTHPFRTGDLVLMCNTDQATVGRLTTAATGSATLSHVAGDVAVAIDNKAGSWNYGADPIDPAVARILCLDLLPTSGTDGRCDNTMVARLQAIRWFVGQAADGSTSLYRAALENDGAGGLAVVPREVAANVTDMEVQYMVQGADYADASAIAAANWAQVVAIRITLSIATAERIGLDGNPVTRNLVHVVSLRNRLK